MAWTRAGLALVAVVAAGVVLVSGGSSSDPQTPAALPGLPPPFLGTALLGSGGLTAAVDSYGDVVDLRPAPAGRALIDNPASRQAAGTVPADTGVVPRVAIRGGPALPLWRADSVVQRYRPGTDVVVTAARFGTIRVEIVWAAGRDSLGCLTQGSEGARVFLAVADAGVRSRLDCDDRQAREIVGAATRSDRRWLSRARPLGAGAPSWASRMYRRSLLVLRALTGRRTGAVAAGARDGWAYVWPRDAATAALAFEAAGYPARARRVARYLLGLDLDAAARFGGDGEPVPGRGAQGDALGWVTAAARATGLPPPSEGPSWRNRPDYQEKGPGDYLANAVSSTPTGEPKASAQGTESAHRQGGWEAFEAPAGLVRIAGEPGSGVDSAAAWAVRPFPQPALFPAVRRSLLHLLAGETRFGIVPSEGWPGADPWTAPTAWSAWSLAALGRIDERRGRPSTARGDRGAALALLGDLRRAATPTGALPERVGARSGIPRSTTPLAWSHAFAILALRQLWPGAERAGG